MIPNQEKLKLIVICGPTGVGKTSVAIKLAETFKGEIIGADSMQIYRHMDIGTAKPSVAERSRIPHHLIDIIDPDEPFDAASFRKTAQEKISCLKERGNLPFVVGGTGLYIKSLLYGLSRAVPADKDILGRLKKEASELGSDHLHRRLLQLDPSAAEKIHPNDLFRITRALEIVEKTGKRISLFNMEHGFREEQFNALKFGLYLDRDLLYQQINSRVETMISDGFINEVRRLLEMGYAKDLKSMQSIGYRHIITYLDGNTNLDETVILIKRDTRRYAKRQLTWFRGDSQINWFKPDEVEAMKKRIQEFLTIS